MLLGGVPKACRQGINPDIKPDHGLKFACYRPSLDGFFSVYARKKFLFNKWENFPFIMAV
jgi:hypothetical protein